MQGEFKLIDSSLERTKNIFGNKVNAKIEGKIQQLREKEVQHLIFEKYIKMVK